MLCREFCFVIVLFIHVSSDLLCIYPYSSSAQTINKEGSRTQKPVYCFNTRCFFWVRVKGGKFQIHRLYDSYSFNCLVHICQLVLGRERFGTRGI